MCVGGRGRNRGYTEVNGREELKIPHTDTEASQFRFRWHNNTKFHVLHVNYKPFCNVEKTLALGKLF